MESVVKVGFKAVN